jgi:hypothetical protein
MTYIPRYALKDSASLKAKPSAVLIAGIEDGKTVPVCGVKASKMQDHLFRTMMLFLRAQTARFCYITNEQVTYH